MWGDCVIVERKEYYDANGRRTNGLQKGLNIVKRGSKTYKIMVK